MAIRFQYKGILNRERGLTFDDVLIVPTKSEVKSRRNPNLETKATVRAGISMNFRNS